MAEQRGGEVRNLKLGGFYEAINVDDGVKNVDSSGNDGWGGLHGGGGGTNEVNGFSLGSASAPIRIRSRRLGGGGGGRNEVDGFSVGSAPRRLRMKYGLRVDDCRDGLVTNEDWENQDFGRDTNRHDYFRVTAFDVHGDDNLAGIASDGGGGGGGTRDRGVVVGPRPELERGSATVGTGGRIRTRQVPARIFASNGYQSVVQRPEQERDNGGGRRRHHVVVDSSLEQESGSATARAGGDDETREVPVGILANNGSDSGKAVVQRPKREGFTVTTEISW
ncbi:hypothetical protein L2E82_11342 [Cichorium intybus]|uniref:Uncharacterized protein n=1 Tax=Cichorium intybus TaxID=13427 RepID=A0ACB9GE31_CICIN|nr:hypothetical protein L2E82_11342 [Cichorium intybus]